MPNVKDIDYIVRLVTYTLFPILCSMTWPCVSSIYPRLEILSEYGNLVRLCCTSSCNTQQQSPHFVSFVQSMNCPLGVEIFHFLGIQSHLVNQCGHGLHMRRLVVFKHLIWALSSTALYSSLSFRIKSKGRNTQAHGHSSNYNTVPFLSAGLLVTYSIAHCTRCSLFHALLQSRSVNDCDRFNSNDVGYQISRARTTWHDDIIQSSSSETIKRSRPLCHCHGHGREWSVITIVFCMANK